MSGGQSVQRSIEIRKKQEQTYRDFDAVKAADQKTLQIANFEILTSHRIERKMKQGEFVRGKQEQEAFLALRRQQLAELYNREIEEWRSEALMRVETQEDRKARIMERAYALRDAREKERLETVRAKYDLQWRDACDDARALDSVAMTTFMANQRLQQMEEKKRLKLGLSAEENAFVNEWKRQLAIDEQLEREKQEEHRRLEKNTQTLIRAQMQENSATKESHKIRTKEEAEDEIARIRASIEEEDEIQYARQEREKQRGKDIKKFNEAYKHILEERRAVEKEQEAILLEYALRKEREQNAAEEAKRQANRQAALQFRKYLEDLMVKEAEDTAFMDEVCKREEERVWKQRDDALQARQDARDTLMRMVDQGRQEQIQAKREVFEKEKDEGRAFALRFLEETKDGIEKDRSEMVQRRVQNVDNKEKLAQQIAIRRHKEELEKQEAYLSEKHAMHMERMHQQKLAEQGGSVRAHRPLKSGQWFS